MKTLIDCLAFFGLMLVLFGLYVALVPVPGEKHTETSYTRSQVAAKNRLIDGALFRIKEEKVTTYRKMTPEEAKVALNELYPQDAETHSPRRPMPMRPIQAGGVVSSLAATWVFLLTLWSRA